MTDSGAVRSPRDPSSAARPRAPTTWIAPALLAAIALAFSPVSVSAQFPTGFGWVLPRVSPRAVVTQQVGLTEISIEYHRPAAGERGNWQLAGPAAPGRTIWGEVVPFDEVWRAGANEATRISFSTDVRVEGQSVAAGTYALFVLPDSESWTLILNSRADLWGAFAYDETFDVLRVPMTLTRTAHKERLEYSFPEVSDTSAVASLRWEQLQADFTVSTDVLSEVRATLASSFDAFAAWFAADYFLENGVELDEALKWANVAVALDESTSNLFLKARVLAALDRVEEAIETVEHAAEVGGSRVREAADALIEEWRGRTPRPSGDRARAGVTSLREVPGVEGTYPSWSPDGEKLAFERGGDLFVVALDGSREIALAPHASLDETPVWTTSGDILFASERNGELDVFAVRPDGAGLRRLTTDPADDDHPRVAPGGSSIVFNSKRHDGETYQIWMMDLDGGDPRRLTYHDEWDTYPSLARDGRRILWRRVLLEDGRRNSEVFVMDLDEVDPVNLTAHPGFDGYPVWSPDEQWIAFASDRDSEGSDQLFLMRSDGSDVTRLNELEPGVQYARPSWSPDGQRIVATREENGVTTLVLLTLEGTGAGLSGPAQPS